MPIMQNERYIIGERDKAEYEAMIFSDFNIPENSGKVLIMNRETGEYEIETAQNIPTAIERRRAKNPSVYLHLLVFLRPIKKPYALGMHTSYRDGEKYRIESAKHGTAERPYKRNLFRCSFETK